MTAAEYNATYGGNSKRKPRKPPDGTTTPPKPKEADTPKILAARREVLRPARLAYENTTFGVTLYCRKYQLTDPAHAAQLDQLFYQLTNTKP